MTLSVLVACYNGARTLGETLRSLIAQTRPPEEIVVVDDGSLDESREVAASFADKGVLLICQENRGASAARNRAFAASTGRNVMFVDADDLISPNHLKALEARLEGTARHVAFSRWDRFYQNPDEAKFPERHTEIDLPGPDWLVQAWSDARPMTQPGMMLIPRILIEENGGWDERLSLIDDFEFFARILVKSEGLRFSPEAALYYRSGLPFSLSKRKNRASIESQLLSLMLGTGHLLAVRDDCQSRAVCAGLMQDFEYSHYPEHPDLRAQARARAAALGGSSLPPDGPPGFHRLRRFIGWKLARRAQRFAEVHGLNSAGRARRT